MRVLTDSAWRWKLCGLLGRYAAFVATAGVAVIVVALVAVPRYFGMTLLPALLSGLVVALVFVLGVASFGFAAEKATDACDKCHKGDKTLDKVAAAKGIKTGDELVKALRGGSKAKMHEKFTDDQLKAAAKEAGLK